MQKLSLSLFVILLVAATSAAQPPENRQGPPGVGGPPGARGGRGGFRGPPGFRLMEAPDADKNGKISAKEIDNAVVALQKLDTDQDGKLSGKEIGWPPTFAGGRGGFPGFGGGAAERPQRPQLDAAESAKAERRPRSFFSVEQLKSLDRNRDTKITKDEIPSGLQERILGRVDTNKDNVIDQAELTKLENSQGANKRK